MRPHLALGPLMPASVLRVRTRGGAPRFKKQSPFDVLLQLDRPGVSLTPSALFSHLVLLFSPDKASVVSKQSAATALSPSSTAQIARADE